MFDDPNAGTRTLMNTGYDMAVLARQNGDAARNWKARAEVFEARIRELELALSVEKAHAGGREAQFDALMAAHPQGPLAGDSGKRFVKTGKVKTRARLIYEEAFDRIAKARHIRVPTEYREN